MPIGMWRQQAKMYGLDPDAMIAGDAPDWTRDAPARQVAVASARHGSGAGRSDDMAAPTTTSKAGKSAYGAGEKAAAMQAAGAASAAVDSKVPRQSPL